MKKKRRPEPAAEQEAAMTQAQLERTFAWFRSRPRRLRALRTLNSLCTLVPYGVFPTVLAALAWKRDPNALRLALTCGVSFAALSLLRRLLNRPRPYEVYHMAPLLHKDTRGKSFPSRHVFSIFVIAVSLLYVLPRPYLGAVLLGLGVVLAAVRVLAGVHFLRDVLAGAAIGVLSAVIGFSLFP
jgi:membrane-associated phospholipid phosphatase